MSPATTPHSLWFNNFRFRILHVENKQISVQCQNETKFIRLELERLDHAQGKENLCCNIDIGYCFICVTSFCQIRCSTSNPYNQAL